MPASKFNVVVDVPLTKAQAAALNKDIQAVVSKHIGQIDNVVLGKKIKFPKDWIGIWVKDFRTLDALKASESFRKF